MVRELPTRLGHDYIEGRSWAAVCRDNTLTDVEAEPAAFEAILDSLSRAVEAIEDFHTLASRDSDATIDNAKFNGAAGDHANAEANVALVGGVFDRVVNLG